MKPYRIESLDQLAAETSDGLANVLQSGRNVQAGYIRGVGLEFKNLFELCRSDQLFQQAFAASHGRSVVLAHKLANIMLLMRFGSVDHSANIIEFGSFKGGSALFMAAIGKLCGYPGKIFALDTFQGMPSTDTYLDEHTEGDFVDADYNGLIRLKDEMGLENLVVLKGLFSDTVQGIDKQDRRFGIAHVDCDIYPSVKFSIDWVKPYMVRGGYIVCDDPLTSTCLGAMQAVEECLVRCGVSAEQVFPHLVYRWPAL